jgi:hypothetical protein
VALAQDWAHEAHLSGRPTMQLGRAAKFSRSAAFRILDTSLADLHGHVVKTVFGNVTEPGRLAKGVGPVGPTYRRLGPGLVPHRPFMSNCGPYGAFP